MYSSVLSYHLFLVSSASVRSILFLSFIVPIFAWNILLVSIIFSKRSLVFLISLFSSISLHISLRKTFLSLLAILWNSAFRHYKHRWSKFKNLSKEIESINREMKLIMMKNQMEILELENTVGGTAQWIGSTSDVVNWITNQWPEI